MSEPIRLLLIDHLTLFRRSLAALLNRRRGLRVVGEAASGSEAIEQAQHLRPDIALVEPEVPDGGTRLIEALCRAASPSAVLVLTQAGDGVTRALRAGARGYLHKGCEPEELVSAIERVHGGQLVVAPGLADVVLKELSGEPASGPDPGLLTEREQQVLRLVAQGYSNSEIARELFVTEHTAKGHLAKILAKLGLANRVKLATYALQHGLTPGPIADDHGSDVPP